MDFDGDLVRQLSVRRGDETHVFTKTEDRWIYQPEPDLPLDSAKVENLLLQVRDLRTERYVAHVLEDLATYALSDPFHEVSVTLEDETNHVLWVSDRVGTAGKNKGYYATVQGGNGVFLLTPDSVERFKVSLDDLEQEP
jgi:hypothetical protein